MEIRIGIALAQRDLVVELEKALTAKQLTKLIETASNTASGLFELVDSKGRTVLVNSNKVNYIHLGSDDSSQQIGFGA